MAVSLQEEYEFDFNFPDIVERLNASHHYISAIREAYIRVPYAFVIAHALAVFQRTLITGTSL